MRKERHPAVMIEVDQEPQGCHVSGHLSCQIRMAITPSPAALAILDLVGMRGQVDLGRQNTDDVRIRAAIEDLRC
jgi:hypothetical protein